MITQKSREGELFIDHRASPGMPKGFMRSLGLDAPDVIEGKMWVGATLTCCHCNAVVIKNHERKRSRGHCFKCDAYICDACEANKTCTPFSKILDNEEKRIYRAEQNNLLLRFNLTT
jgi:hypothetical protein